jgi:hypothetical protein
MTTRWLILALGLVACGDARGTSGFDEDAGADTGAPAVDTGVPPVDTGNPGFDAGNPSFDAGIAGGCTALLRRRVGARVSTARRLDGPPA